MLKNPKRSGKGPEGAGVCPARPGRAARVSGGAGERPARAEATCGSWGEPPAVLLLHPSGMQTRLPATLACQLHGRCECLSLGRDGQVRACGLRNPQRAGGEAVATGKQLTPTKEKQNTDTNEKKKAHSLKGPARGCWQRSQRLLLRPGKSDSAASPRQSRDSGERTRHKPIEPSEPAMPEEEESPSLLAGVKNTVRCHTASRTRSAVVGASRTHWGQTGLIQTLASARTAVSPGHLAQHRAHSRCSVHVQ